MIGVAAGAAVGTSAQGAVATGSGSTLELHNNTIAEIEDATVNASTTSVDAKTKSRLINVAGQVSVGKGNVTAGASVAINDLDNLTGAYVRGAHLTSGNVNVIANNESKNYAIAAGVVASTNQQSGAANSNVAINKGGNSTEAIVDEYKETETNEGERGSINNATDINVTATDNTVLKAIAGGVTIGSGYVSIGGAVAYNEISGQRNIASLSNNDITTLENSTIDVKAIDTSDLLTIAAGGSVSTAQQSGVAQGSVAIAQIGKLTEASMSGSNINAASDDQNAAVSVVADSDTSLTTSADVLSVGMGYVSAGAGVAVTKSDADTKAIIAGGEHNVKSELVQADSNNEMFTIGIGVSATGGQGGSLAGNVAVNNITNDTEAVIRNNATINASGSVGVLANSNEHLENYAGALSATVGQGYVAVGMSVAVNNISGNTSALVDESNVIAQGNDEGIGVVSYTEGSDGEYVATNSKLNGLVVNADAKHELDNIVITAGAAISAQGGGALSGTVAVNTLEGATSAIVKETNVNNVENVADTADVNVLANDYTDISSHVGSAAVGIGSQGGAAIGEAADSSKLSRDVYAQVVGSVNETAVGVDRFDVNVDKLNVKALNRHEVLTAATGVSVAAGMYGNGSIAGAISVLNLDNKTIAGVANVDSVNNGMQVLAHQDNEVEVYNNSASLGGSIGGGGIGAGIHVLKDSSVTNAVLQNANVAHDNNDSDDSIVAKSDTDVKTELSNAVLQISIGAGIGGVVSVNNINNVVQTDVVGANISGGDEFTAKAENNITTDYAAGVGAGGLVAVATGVSVNNINSATVTNVTGSNIIANTINVLADENRDVEQLAVGAVVGGVAVPVNVLVTNIGTEVGMNYGTVVVEKQNTDGTDSTQSETVGENVSIQDSIDDADQAVNDQNSALENTPIVNVIGESSNVGLVNVEGVNADSGLRLDDINSGLTKSVYNLSENQVKGIKVNINGGELNAAGNVNIKADATTNADIGTIDANVTIAEIASTVSVVNIKRDSGINVTDNSRIIANEVVINSEQDGNAAIDSYQAGLSGASVNITYAGVDLTGSNKITVSNSTVDGKNGVDVSAIDNSAVDVEVLGASVAIAKVGALVGKAVNDSDNEIIITSSNLKSDAENIEIESKKNNIVESEVTNGAGGLASINATVSIAEDKGDSKVAVNSGNIFTAKKVDINAISNPAVKAAVDSIQVQILGSVGGSVANASAIGAVQATVDSGNVFTAKDVNISANAGCQSEKDTVEASVFGVNASGFISGSANVATAKSDMDVIVNVNTSTNNGTSKYNVENLTVSGVNVASIAASSYGVEVSGLYASGNNVTKTNGKFDTTVTVTGDSDNVLDNVTVEANTSAIVDNDANGYGGSIVGLSPLAAYADNDIVTNTAVSISGTWDVDGNINVSALNSDTLDVTADSVKAAVVGASGTRLDNDVRHNAKIDIAGTIVSDGKQAYIAGNNLDHDVNLDASGYGGINVAAGDLNNDLDAIANINVNGATLSGIGHEGSIEAVAYTEGNLDYDNVLKSAGVIQVAVADSEHEITYGNAVNISGETTITTAKKYQDITLAAYDDSVVNLYSTADTQGGAVGAASAKTDSELNRSNKINVSGDTNIESTNDVNLYAGAQRNGIASSLIYNIVADAYNKTLIPICTSPDVNNSMSQANIVSVAGNVESVRHVNLKANKGYTDVVESAREYNFYTGESGSASITSTANNETNSNELHNNFVDVSGSVKAGIHNSLDLNISGNVVINSPVGENPEDVSSGSINYEGIIKTVGSGQDEWFDVKTVTTDAVEITNGLIPRYNEVVELMNEYASSSNEYKLYESELARLKKQMIDNGFAVTKDDKTYILESVIVPAIALPDIVVSGGDIVMDTDKYNVTGKLNAQGAEHMNITNSSNLYIKVNDLVIGSVGGNIYHNDVLVPNMDNHITSIAGSDQQPSINVKSTGASNAVSKADIGIFGDIINSTGDVIIENANHNINVDGTARLTARNITLKADSGSVTQNSDGLLLVGGDPITKYQFSEKVAKKIQEYISEELSKDNPSLPAFANYEDYKNWLKDTVGVSEADLLYTIDESAGIIAGENIYLSGLNVNIDGLVQSGYQNYSVVLDDASKNKVEELDREWRNNGKALDDSIIIGSEKYRVNSGGAVYNSSTKVYDYEVKVYYNPSTKQLLAEEIAPGGGSIYITGAVSSTGNGRVRAMDGTAEININTLNVERDLSVNTISAQNVSGLISIKDTQTNTLTEFTNGNTTVTPLPGGGNTAGRYTVNDDGIYYNPQAALTVSWTGGISGSKEVVKKSYREKFVMWGLIDYDKTSDFVNSIVDRPGQLTVTPATTIPGGDVLANGVVIGAKNVTNEYTVTGSYQRDESSTLYSPITVDKEYSNTPLGEIFGYGYCTYTWTETTGTSTTSTYTIKADKPIDVGFLSNGTGAINIQAANDILLEGNISNAVNESKNGIGFVNIYSSSGSVSAVGDALINSDNFAIDAYSGIKINHSAIGDSAVAKLNTVKNNIDIESEKGNLRFDGSLTLVDNPVRNSQVLRFAVRNTVNTMGSRDGDFYYISEGDIDFGDTVLVGQRIDLISTTGSIKAIVAPGTGLTSSDTMSASVNASAYGDITLSNTNGDMRVGHIESTAGNVTLTTSGSFVGAVGDASLSDADSKLERWIALGLINTQDAASEKVNAANASKTERLEAITNRAEAIGFADYETAASAYYDDSSIVAAKESYITAVKAAGGDTDKVNAAYATYQQAQADYFTGKGYTVEQQAIIADYAEINNSSAYGWSANDLLYAIQDSVLNSVPGQVVTVDKANVSGVNVTLNAADGAIGVDGAEVKINNTDISNIDNLKILSQAKAGDLTWTADGVTVRQQKPLTVDATGQITLKSSENVYLAGVKDSALNISGNISVNAGKDVKLMSDNGIIMNTGAITANNLIAYGGDGDVGSLENMLTTYLTGALDVNTSGSAYINQLGNNDLIIQAVAVGKNAVIQAVKNIKMSDVEGKDSGYINASNLRLTSTEGHLGLADDAIRILNNGVVVSATATTGDVYLQGVDTGSMVLKEIRADELVLESEGSIDLGIETTEGTVVENDIYIAESAALKAFGDIDLNAGIINVASGKSLVLETTNGAVIQKANHKLVADNLVVKSVNGIELNSGAEADTVLYNELNNVAVTNNNGDIIVGNGGDKALNININDNGVVNNGNITIKHYYGNGKNRVNVLNEINAIGSVNIENKGEGITAMDINSGKYVDIKADGDVITKDIVVNVVNSISDEVIEPVDGSVVIEVTNGDVTTGNISATENVLIMVETGNVKTNNIIGKAINIEAVEGNVNTDDITADDNVLVDVGTGDVETKNVVGKAITVEVEKGNVKTENITADDDVLVDVGTGDIKTKNVVGKAVNVEVVKGNVKTDDITATERVFVDVETGTVNTGNTKGKVVTVDVEVGDIDVDGNIKSDEDIIVVTEQGSITLNGDVTSVGGNVEVRTNDDKDYSDITLNGEVVTEASAEEGSITIEPNKGNVHVNDNVIVNSSALLAIYTNDGDITTPRNDENEDVPKVVVQSVNGSVEIVARANGDIDLYEVLADNEASIVANSGNVSLHQINGRIVALQTTGEDGRLTVDTAVVGETLRLNSFDSAIGSIEQREGATDALNVEMAAGDPNKPMNNIELAFDKMDNGVAFDNLWTNNATISVASGELHLPKLAVLNEATFTASGYETTVYGAPPVRNDSNAIYWYNVVKNNPADNINAWYDNNASGNWMNLHFAADGATQYSNGVLLYLDNYYYVYDQRFTAVDHLNERLARNANEVYVKTFTPDISYYRRYDLYDLPKFDYEEAGEEDIIVETI